MELPFEKLLVKLAEAQVRFIVVGGLAVVLQGYVRFTADVDILLDNEKGNVALLLQTLKDFGEGYARELSPKDFDDEEGAIRIIEESEKCEIDLFTCMSGKRYQDIIANADSFVLDNHCIYYASKTSLIFWKERSVRDKDRLDANALKALLDNPHYFD